MEEFARRNAAKSVVGASIRPTSRLRCRCLACRLMSSRSLWIVGLLLACVVAASKPLKKDEYCGICEVVIQYLDSLLENNATVAEIEKAIEKVCNFLPKSYTQQCDDFIEKYGAGIIILLEEVADPKVICQELGLCSNATQKNVMKPMKMMVLEPAVYTKENIISKETAPLLGKNKCTWGPAYWCSNVDNAKACNAMEHCKNYVWKN